MSFKDFVKPLVYRNNRYYLGKELHKKQMYLYIAIYTVIFGIVFAFSKFNLFVILIWAFFVGYVVLRYFTIDWGQDALGYEIGNKILGESKITSDPDVHKAIKELEKNSSHANKEEVAKAIKRKN